MLTDYIEVIDGGYPKKGESRKNVVMVKDMKVEKRYESYRSLWNYSEDYKKYVDKTGGITGYRGKHNSDILFFDFDIDNKGSGTIDDVREEVIKLVEMLMYSYEIDKHLIRITFSGGKGFHVILPFQLVQLEPDMTETFCDRYREMIKIIVGEFQYADTSIYNINRVIRIVNTQHGKSKLFKIPVTLEELKDKQFDVKKWATKPRNANWEKIDIEEIDPNPELNDIWRSIKVETKSNEFKPTTGVNTFVDAVVNNAPEGRHQALAKVIGALVDKDIEFTNGMAIATIWNNNLKDPMTPERLEKDVRGMYQSFWNRRPSVRGSESSIEANQKAPSEVKSKLVSEPSLRDILVYGHKYNELYHQHITRISKGGRVKTGFDTIDEPIRGMIAGEVLIIVGKTSVGKSAFVQNIMLNNVDSNRVVLFFSLEMPLPTVAERTLQMRLHKSGRQIEHQFLHGDMVTQQEAEREFDQLDNFLTIPIQGIKYEKVQEYIFETEQIIGKKVEMVCIDYAGLMKGDGGTLYEQQSEISRDIKALSGRTETAVVSLAQVSKQYSDTTPIDLDATRDSGVITEASDYVIGLWRGQGYDKENIILKGNVAKNRNGRKVNFDATFSRNSLLFDISEYIPDKEEGDELPF